MKEKIDYLVSGMVWMVVPQNSRAGLKVYGGEAFGH
jgi:hypothetical protein